MAKISIQENSQSKNNSEQATVVEIRRAKYHEMTTVADLINSSADWYESFVCEKDMIEHRPGQAWIEKNYFKREFYLASADGATVGTISYQDMGDHAYLGYIYLSTENVGRGYGKQLMVHAQSLAKDKKKKGLVLLAHPEAKWATKAYRKFGFQILAEKKKDILAWQGGALDGYYEEGFELYAKRFD